MRDMMEYKEYLGSVAYSAEDALFHGRLEGIRDLVTYEGEDEAGLEAAFREAVEDYLDLCRQENRRPEVPRSAMQYESVPERRHEYEMPARAEPMFLQEE